MRRSTASLLKTGSIARTKNEQTFSLYTMISNSTMTTETETNYDDNLVRKD